MKKINKKIIRIIAVICAIAMLGTVAVSILTGVLGYI